MILNDGFEDNSAFCRTPVSNSSWDFRPFKPNNDNTESNVMNWFSAHGSPQISKPSCTSNEVIEGSNSAFLSYTDIGGISNRKNFEGIFQNALDINEGQAYNFWIRVNGLFPTSRIIVNFCNGLTNDTTSTVLPSPSSNQLVLDQTVGLGWHSYFISAFVANHDFNQIWIRADIADINVDGIKLYKSCCDPFKEYQNLINPPSTFVNDFIRAGESIDSSKTLGKVVITNDADSVVFQAGNEIELLEGFETEDSAIFVAQIKPCGLTPLQVSVINIPQENICERKLKINVCYGSGFYGVKWTPDLQSSGDVSTTNAFPLDDISEVRVRVLDLMTGDSVVKIIDFSDEPFFGGMPFKFGNVVTPNGDSINDIWVVRDTLDPGKQHFAYNIYRFHLQIFNRWGIRIHNQLWENKEEGFSDESIRWDEDLCDFPDGTYFGILEMENCVHDEIISFIIDLTCPSAFKLPISSGDILKSLPREQLREYELDSVQVNHTSIDIFPNPTENNVTISFVCQKAEITDLEITDATGLALKNLKFLNKPGTNLHIVSIEDLSKGSYIFKLNSNNHFSFYQIIKY